jgi:hypothetical protein
VLTVNTVPVIVTQPANQTVNAGQNATFKVTGGGNPPPAYRWQRSVNGGTTWTKLANGAAFSGVTTSTLLVTSPPASMDNNRFRCVMTNSAGTVTSNSVVLTVRRRAISGSTSAGAGTGATTATYVISNVQLTDAATYSAVVSNSAGSANSDGVTLTVTAAPATMISPASTTASATAQIYVITVTSNVGWTAGSSQPWAVVSPAGGSNNGTVTVTVAANTSASNRSAVITVGGRINALTQTGTGTVIITLPLTVTTLAGLPLTKGSIDGIGSSARFYYPTGIAADNAGNLYVSDTDNNTIRKIVASTGQVTTIAGLAASSGSTDGTGSAALFDKPSGIAVENISVAIDDTGNVFVADTMNHTLRKITSLHAVSTIAGSAGQGGYTDGAGNAARFQGPQGLAFCQVTSATGTESDLYIADTNNQTIRKINLSTGLVTTVAGLAGIAGSTDGMSTSARFNSPTDVAVDQNGTLFVADSENHTIREILPSGLVSTLAGRVNTRGSADGTGSAARFNTPSALAVDLSHNVYVADTDNNTIRMIIPLTGVVSTLAGLAGTSGTADGLGSAVRFYNPTGITVDTKGDLYVADTNNHTIRLGMLPSMPAILAQPQSVSMTVGNSARFSVTAAGRPAVKFQWYHNGATITGATDSTYTLSMARPADAGDYTVVVYNLVGFVTSIHATLTVGTAPTTSVNDGGGSGGVAGQGVHPACGFAAHSSCWWRFVDSGNIPPNPPPHERLGG